MREMKDSGVEWIGEIPEDWNVGKTLYALSMPITDGPHETPELFDEGIPFISAEAVSCGNGHIDFEHIRGFISQEFYEECCKKYIPQINDIYMIKSGATTGKVAKVETQKLFTIWSPLAVFRVEPQRCYYEYLYYFIQSDAYQKQIENKWTYGTQQNIGMRTLEKLMICFPSITQQKLIADYLDAKCSKIDEIIEKQQAIIEKLKEYKLSTITEVVTSGLNQKREMKDSHVLSIGRIPTNWDVTKLKYLFGNGDDGLKIGPFGSAIKGKTLESGLYKIYNQAHLINNDFSLNRHYVSEDTFNDLKAYEVKPGDVLFSMMGTIGKCQIMPKGYPKGIMDSHLLKARLNEKVIPEFFIYAYDKDFSNQVIQQLLYTSNGTIMNGLNSTILKNVYIALPPLEEQEEIVEFLNKFTKNIDDRIGVKTKIVEKLQEYKKSLIYEVVTGKKEV